MRKTKISMRKAQKLPWRADSRLKTAKRKHNPNGFPWSGGFPNWKNKKTFSTDPGSKGQFLV
jgi:hypothetical protein